MKIINNVSNTIFSTIFQDVNEKMYLNIHKVITHRYHNIILNGITRQSRIMFDSRLGTIISVKNKINISRHIIK